MTKKKSRNYRNEYDAYQGSEEQKKKRASRNKARRMLMKEGKVRKGDGLDVDHSNSNPLDDKRSNLRVRSKNDNRSFPRTRTAREKRKKGS